MVWPRAKGYDSDPASENPRLSSQDAKLLRDDGTLI
jgi:hypothetical protein